MIPIESVKLISKKIVNETYNDTFEYMGHKYTVNIKIKRRRTNVTITEPEFKIRASVYCCDNDVYDKQEGILRAFKKALAKQLLKEANA